MDRVAPLLAQFPGPVTLATSKWKWLGLSAAAAAFTGGGIAENINATAPTIFDWVGVAFFGLCTISFVLFAVFAGSTLILDEAGFGWRIGRTREQWRWADVADLAVVEYVSGLPGGSLRKQVGFNDKRPVKTTSQRLGEGLNQALTQRDCFVPDAFGPSSFGLPMEDLARLMSQWQERALAGRRASSIEP